MFFILLQYLLYNFGTVSPHSGETPSEYNPLQIECVKSLMLPATILLTGRQLKYLYILDYLEVWKVLKVLNIIFL